jgi:hypothetical protein
VPVGPDQKYLDSKSQKKEEKDTLKHEAAIDMTARQRSRNSSRELGKFELECGKKS